MNIEKTFKKSLKVGQVRIFRPNWHDFGPDLMNFWTKIVIFIFLHFWKSGPKIRTTYWTVPMTGRQWLSKIILKIPKASVVGSSFAEVNFDAVKPLYRIEFWIGTVQYVVRIFGPDFQKCRKIKMTILVQTFIKSGPKSCQFGMKIRTWSTFNDFLKIFSMFMSKIRTGETTLGPKTGPWTRIRHVMIIMDCRNVPTSPNLGSRRWNWKFREKAILKSETRISVTIKL